MSIGNVKAEVNYARQMPMCFMQTIKQDAISVFFVQSLHFFCAEYMQQCSRPPLNSHSHFISPALGIKPGESDS